MNLSWESIDKSCDGYTQRMKTFNGWLVRTFDLNESCMAITFVKDKFHLWAEDVFNDRDASLKSFI